MIVRLSYNKMLQRLQLLVCGSGKRGMTMRLVDADALIENMEDHVTTMSVCLTTIEAQAKTEMKKTCIADVKSAPTVDAIPVEWLVNLKNEYAREGHEQAEGDLIHLLLMWRDEQEAQDG